MSPAENSNPGSPPRSSARAAGGGPESRPASHGIHSPPSTPQAPGGKSAAPLSPRSPVQAGEAGGPAPEKRGERIQRLGVGGFGEVWKVRYLNSDEAWKYLLKRPGTDLQAFREAFNARGIDHPNIVRIQDIEEDAEHYILRMDLVRGRDLHRVVEEDGVLPPVIAARYVLQVAGALEAAHAAGVLHLDLKPSNLILRDDGETVMITDFGLSATLRKDVFQRDSTKVRGTAYFIAPEQLRAGDGGAAEVGPGVDIWALGITIYYLLARGYPFPFRAGDATSILEQAPRPIAELAPYVSGQLWSIIEKMLRRDPAQRFRSMAEVEAAIRGYLDEIACPACKRTFPVESVQGVCPGTGCQSPQLVVDEKAKRLLMRMGHTYFARCDHAKAIESYRKVTEHEKRSGGATTEFTERAERLITIAGSDREELAERLEAVRRTRAGGDLLRTMKEIDNARKRFSAAREIRKLRQETLGAIRELYDSVGKQIPALVRETRFADAKLILTQIEGYLGYEPIRLHLVEGAGAGQEAPAVRDLFSFVEEREAFYLACRREVDERVAALELERAAGVLQRLQKHFPNPAHLERIRLYVDLQEALEQARRFDAEAVMKALAGEGSLPLQAIEPQRVLSQCDALLSNLDAAKVPALAEISERRAGVQRVIDIVRSRRDKLLQEFEAAEREADLRVQLRCLKTLASMAEKTDLLPTEETVRYRDRLKKLLRIVERADHKFEEGMRLLKENNFGLAQTAFEEAESIAPGLHPEIPEKIQECHKLTEQNRLIGEQMFQVYNRILGEDASLEDFKSYFQMTAQSQEFLEQETLVDSVKKTSRVVSRLLTLQGARIGQAAEEAARFETFTAAIDVLAAIPESTLTSLLEIGSELNERFLDFFGRLFGPLERSRPGPGEVDERIALLRGIAGEMARLRGAIRRLKPLEFHAHPAERASAAIIACRPALLERPDVRELLGSLIELHGEIAELAEDAKVLKRIRKGRDVLRGALRRLGLGRVLARLGRLSAWAAVPAITAALVAGILYYYFGIQEMSRRVERARAHAGAEPLRLSVLPEDWAGKVRRSDEGLDAFIALLVEARGGADPRPDAAGGIAGLAAWVGRQQAAIEALAKLRSEGGAGQEASWNEQIEARIELLAAAAGEGIREFLERELSAIGDRSRAVSLRGDPRRPLREAREALLGAGRIAGWLKGRAGDDLARLEARAAALEGIEKAAGAAAGEFAPALAAIEAGDAIGSAVKEIARRARLAFLAQELIRRSRDIHWNDAELAGYPGYLRGFVAEFLAAANGLPGGLEFAEPLDGLEKSLAEVLAEMAAARTSGPGG